MSLRLPVHVRSVATARTLLDKTLRDARPLHDFHNDGPHLMDTDIPDDAALMLSELMTNAVRHTHSLLWLDITIDIDGHTLHVAVTDDAPDLPVLRNPDPDDTNGRGMRIIDTLATRWGTTHTTDHKTVWFELLLPRQTTQRPQA